MYFVYKILHFTAITCLPPPTPTGVTYSPNMTRYNWNSSVTFMCDEYHHYVNGTLYEANCSDNGTFSPVTDLDCSGKRVACVLYLLFLITIKIIFSNHWHD